jgi:hypothetical protein
MKHHRIAAACLAVAAVLLTLTATTGQAAGNVYTIAPGDDVIAALAKLRPGDMLKLQPGTYTLPETGTAPTLTPGTADQRITVTAVDGSHLPVIKGFLGLSNASYWTIQYVWFQAGRSGKEALMMAGGTGWIVRKSEFFGAAQMNAYTNVSISGSGSGAPKQWRFTDNCVHDGGTDTTNRPDQQHNIYVNAVGDAPGLIARNLLVNATNGSNIKVGFGSGGSGAHRVDIKYNTMYNARHQILLFDGVGGGTISGNLLVRSQGGAGNVGVYLNNTVNTDPFHLWHNYSFLMDKAIWYPAAASPSPYVDDGDNALRTQDPKISGTGCTGYRSAVSSVASTYGREATAAAGL